MSVPAEENTPVHLKILAEFAGTAPDSFFDPESDQITSAKVTNYTEENETQLNQPAFGNFRKTNITFLQDINPKYSGKRISRNDLNADIGKGKRTSDEEGNSDDNIGSGGNNTDYTEEDTDIGEYENEDTDDDNEDTADENEDASDYDDDGIESGSDQMQEADDKNITSMNACDELGDLEKGKATKTQVELWDKVLENRIRSQKVLQLCNSLPQEATIHNFVEQGGSNVTQLICSVKSSLTNVVSQLCELQAELFKQNGKTNHILTGAKGKRDDSDEEIPSDTDEEGETSKQDIQEDQNKLDLPSKRKHTLSVDEFEEELCKRHKAFETYQNDTIGKWYEKTRLGSGKAPSKSFSSFDRSTLLQIKQVLSDKGRLLKRTQLKRSTYRVLGSIDTLTAHELEKEFDSHLKDYDANIFDDGDFYHELLKELIEHKSNMNTEDSVAVSRQWLQMQKLRAKSRKNVDTKASKGRKVRYNVHPKLLNFMAPEPTVSMPDQARNELFNSLYGKRPQIQAVG